jgi:hypothetical protein
MVNDPFRALSHPIRRGIVELSLEPDVLGVAADWMEGQRALWERLFDVVDDYLKEKQSQ